MIFVGPEGTTPLDPDERQGLRYEHISTRSELDELEQANIEQGLAWVTRQHRVDIFDDAFIRRLHMKLFGDVWTWAGRFDLRPLLLYGFLPIARNQCFQIRRRCSPGIRRPIALAGISRCK
ncbi:hypothetical protein [Acidithiobacillus sulfurivorans]|uniref:Fido domain-containing protein n=1 Tax=Acidithiobacillus sulfurivorans TaxID=1958756 RepID=A0ABS5ZU65_9PROT|nr:hypothetical protein [Acidithiobacillus sulfurivorans]MBU2758714.1 hypothetical protein [Acidithiobacillus sulfurivorans]